MLNSSKIATLSLCLCFLGILPAGALPSCLPDGNYDLLAKHQEDSKLYSFLSGNFENSPGGSFLTLEEDGQCTVLATDVNDTGVLVLDSYLPETVSRNLYYNHYNSFIERAGGLGPYQEAVNESAAVSIEKPFSYISPSEEWALLELGVELPEDRVIASVDPEEERVYRLLDSIGSPAFGADSIENIRFSSDYFLASFTQNDSENIVFAKLLEGGGIEYIFSGLEEEYNPEMLSYEYRIPLSIFEGFEE